MNLIYLKSIRKNLLCPNKEGLLVSNLNYILKYYEKKLAGDDRIKKGFNRLNILVR